ncbi:MAG: hypothetical protein R6V85_20890 [Polyangia bacterium]
MMLFSAVAGSCEGGSSEPRAELSAVEAEINFCYKHVAETHEWQGAVLESSGDAPLEITRILLRGDAGCAFGVFREAASGEEPGAYPVPPEEEPGEPISMVLAPGQVAFLEVVYDPPAAGETDSAAIVVHGATSDPEQGRLVIPLCGVGLAPGETSPTAPDAGSDGGPDCPPCEQLDEGAPWCQ